MRADGPLTIDEAARLRDVLLDASSRHPAVTVDLSLAEEMDLACMQVLLAACARTEGRAPVRVRNMPGRLARAFGEAGLPMPPSV